MDHLDELTGSLIDAAVDAVVAGFDEATADHQAMRAKGEHLRDHAMMLALLGPRLYSLARTLLGEVERRSVPRFAAALGHVRYSSDAPINELEDARRTLSQALLKAQSAPGATSALLLTISVVRVRAITQALGAQCIAVPARSGRKELRRREIDAADLAPEAADLIIAMADGDWDEALQQLHALEAAPVNQNGIVTSVVALAEADEGQVHINKIATRLQRAQYARPTDLRQPNVAPPAAADRPNAPKAPAPTLSQVQAREPGPPTDPLGTTKMEPTDGSSISDRFRANPSRKLSADERLRRSQEAHARGSR